MVFGCGLISVGLSLLFFNYDGFMSMCIIINYIYVFNSMYFNITIVTVCVCVFNVICLLLLHALTTDPIWPFGINIDHTLDYNFHPTYAFQGA